jgi:putative hydrolase of the HAD superfamily
MVDFYPDLLAIPLPDRAPPVIFLDAVGTLFGVRGGVGEIYREFALGYGVDCESGAIDRAFYQAFKSADTRVFAGVKRPEIPALEYGWWQEINRQTFMALKQLEQFTNFEAFFGELYAYFATAEAWTVYPDTIPALQRWRQQGCQLGVLSNFDTRLYQVLQELQLNDFFGTVTISTEPDAQIFQQAILHWQNSPQGLAHKSSPPDFSNIWHIGDSEVEDYQGARAYGLNAWCIQRI